jgi:release factor glutamine methyltransferase
MTVGDWLKTRAKILSNNGIDSARLDCVLMLEKVLKRDRGWLLAHLDAPLPDLESRALEMLFAHRYQHQPMAYILGKAEFYGRTFIVNKHVLVPRPESESIITLAKQSKPVDVIVDVGTGSGALAITLALGKVTGTVAGLDIDPACLGVAQQNAEALGARVTWQRSDLLSGWQPATSVTNLGIVANLPYVPDDYPINDAAKHEPKLALFSGPDGLDHYRKLFAQLPQATKWIITEALLQQHEPLAAIAKAAGYQLVATDGLAQYFTQ